VKDVKRTCDVLGEQHRLLLAALAAGLSVAAAAERLSISRRTAQRRLREARGILGVRTAAEAVALAVRVSDPKPCALAPRERQILELVATGLTSREIASHLGIAPWTVDSCARSAMAKTDSRTRVQAAARIAASNEVGADSGSGSRRALVASSEKEPATCTTRFESVVREGKS
jgi:DNA-binding CsgD family transcriptional regulator